MQRKQIITARRFNLKRLVRKPSCLLAGGPPPRYPDQGCSGSRSEHPKDEVN